MWNWKEELLPFIALGVGAIAVLVGWLFAHIREQRAARALAQNEQQLATEPRPVMPVVLEGTLLGSMLAVTVVTRGDRLVELPGPLWDIQVGDRWYTVRMMIVVGDQIQESSTTVYPDEFQAGVFVRKVVVATSRRTNYVPELDVMVPGDLDRHFPVVDTGPRFILRVTTALVVDGVTEEDAENIVSALQEQLNEGS